MQDYVLRLLKADGEPALIYRTQCQGDDFVLAKLLSIRRVCYASFEVWRDGEIIADGPAATRLDEYGDVGTWPRQIRRLGSDALF